MKLLILLIILLLTGCNNTVIEGTLPEITYTKISDIKTKTISKLISIYWKDIDIIIDAIYPNEKEYTYFLVEGNVTEVLSENKDNFFNSTYFYAPPKDFNGYSICKIPKEYTGEVYIVINDETIRAR